MAEHSFCEGVHASSYSRWHIRRLTPAGLKRGGGIDTPSLCGRVRPPAGWDVDVPLSAHHLIHACRRCRWLLEWGPQWRRGIEPRKEEP